MLSDAALAEELAAIGARLEQLAARGGDAATVGPEIGAIRAQLQALAQENPEVGRRLSASLGLEPPRP